VIKSRLPFLIVTMFLLFNGLASGLVRMGWTLPLPSLPLLHGGLMVCGFLGTLISLERAVALGRWWGYLAPMATALGGVALLVTPTAAWPLLLMVLGSTLLLAIFLALLRRRVDLATGCMALAVVWWTAGNVLWWQGAPLFVVVLWWMAFLLWTIAGERLELSRFQRQSKGSVTSFIGVLLLSGSGALAKTLAWLGAPWDLATGDRLFALALLASAAWLYRFDIARRSLQREGLPRFIAVCLLTGYGWLGGAGLLILGGDGLFAGPHYDAALHAFFLGFVFAMIFGHAPIIFPAVLGLPLAFRRRFYLHLGLLHLGLAVRVVGDTIGWRDGLLWGGLANGAALVLFLVSTLVAVIEARVNKPHKKL
jgi:hypothetical protein